MANVIVAVADPEVAPVPVMVKVVDEATVGVPDTTPFEVSN